MKALNRLTLVLAVGLMAVACGDDDEGNGGGGGGLDGGFKPADGGVDGGDGGLTLADLPCKAGTAATADKCGGSHCLQSEAELKAAAVAGATCGGDTEIKSFCSLQAVESVASCTNNAFLQQNLNPSTMETEFKASVNACAATKQPAGFSSTCLNCFVETATCAAKLCLDACLGDTNSDGCTACRVEKGCIDSFYTCAGIANPLDILK